MPHESASPVLLEQARQLSGLATSELILEYLCREARRLAGADRVAGSYTRPGEPWSRGVHFLVDEDCGPAPPEVLSAAFAVSRRLSVKAGPLELHPSDEVAPIFRGFGAAAAEACLRAIPLFNARKRMVGQLILLWSEPSRFAATSMTALLDLAQLSSFALDSAQKLAFARRDQERLLLLAAATEEALWDWDLDSNAFWWGGGIQSLIRSSADVIGSTAGWKLERIHPDDAALVRASLEAGLAGRESTWRAEYRFLRGDGSWAVVDDRAYFLRDGNGRAYRMIGAVRDVSEEKWLGQQQQFLIRASAELAGTFEIGSHLASVAALAAQGIADWCAILLFQPLQDSPTVVAMGHRHPERARRVQAAVKAVIGRDRHAIRALATTGRALPEVTPELARALAERFGELARAVDDVQPRCVLHAPITIAGQFIGCVTLVASEGSTLRYVDADLGLAEELARRCSVAVEKARLYDQAQNSIRSRDAFMAILGHELRNPLAPITTALHLMKLRDPRAQREQDVIERQVKHLTRLVDDLLDVSRIERGKVELSRKPMQLAELVAKAVEMTSPLLEQRRHRLELQVPPAGLPVLADETRMAQVIANLLTNAARYTDEGGCIRLSAFRDAASVVLSVCDNGMGMAPEFVPHVFDLFVQGARTLDRHQGGLGLGLSLVRSFVMLHGGSVEARSEGLGKGSEFIVRLPRLAVELVKAPAAPARREQHVATRCRRVLVVDDNRDAADLLGDLLSTRGHDVRVAHDGPAALALLPEFEPDFVVLDIGLPVMDGYELAPRIAALLPRKPCLVALTGYGQERDRQRAREAGFDEHLTKPVELQHLIGLLEGEGEATRMAPR